jgi:5'-3' exonuclease
MLLNLIVDGNYILSRLVFSLHKNNLLYGALSLSLENTISNYRKIYPFCNIYFVSDSKEKSWRKDINKDYKSGRKKDSDIDWNFVYDTYSEFKKNLNIKVLECPKIEGDDWISYLVNATNLRGESNLIISNDYDIKQLIRFDLNKRIINLMTNEMYNKGKFFMPKNWKIFIESIKCLPNDDIFNLNDNSEFLSLIDVFLLKYELVEIDSVDSLLLKVISGDTSDNIKSVYSKKDKNGNIRGIGIKGAESIISRYYQEFGDPNLSDPDLYENIADLIIEKKKLSNSQMPNLINRIKQNINMVDLRLTSIPDHIVEKMKTEYERI